MSKRRMYSVDFYRRADKLWEWRIIAPNGNIIATSGGQGYTRRYGAVRAFAAIEDAILDSRIKFLYIQK